MKFFSENHNVVIDSQGGSRSSRVLENLGFKSEFAIQSEEKKEESVAKLKQLREKQTNLDGICAICNKPFKKWRAENKCCSRPCGTEYRKRNHANKVEAKEQKKAEKSKAPARVITKPKVTTKSQKVVYVKKEQF